MRSLTVLFVLAVASGCIVPVNPAPSTASIPEVIRVRVGSRIVAVPFEEYVLGTAIAEVSPVGESPATIARTFEVQAVLARTYALAHLGRHRDEGFDVCDKTHCQIYEPARLATSRFADAARTAVLRTNGVVLLYSGRPADAVYHADCGGHTAAAHEVWGGQPVPYLVGMKDDIPSGTHRSWKFEVPVQRLRTALNANPRSAVGRRLDRIAITGRDNSGRAANVRLGGERKADVTGEALRSILNQTLGDRAILSTRFAVKHTRTAYEFDGTGFGHGVGLCQLGALARARRGDAPAQILASYFPGTRLGLTRPRADRNPLGPGGPLLLESP